MVYITVSEKPPSVEESKTMLAVTALIMDDCEVSTINEVVKQLIFVLKRTQDRRYLWHFDEELTVWLKQ